MNRLMGGGGSGETAKDSNDLQPPNQCTKKRRQVEQKKRQIKGKSRSRIPVSERR
jgi:hypothetical protein